MIKLIDKFTGTVMWVTEKRKDEYLAAGHKLAAISESPAVPDEPAAVPDEPAEIPAEAPEEKPRAVRRRRRKEE